MYKLFLIAFILLTSSHFAYRQEKLSDQEVLDFWTPERLKQAKPLPMPILDIHGAPVPRNQSQKFATVPVPEPYSNTPYKGIGRLFFYMGSGMASCTAGAIGGSVIITAGHCVDAFHTNFVFIPQYNNGNEPLGLWVGQGQWTTAEWASGNGRAFARDVGVLKLGTRLGRSIEQVIGHRYTPIFNQPRIFPAVTLGYPGNIDNANKMIQSDGVTSDGHTFFSPATLKLPSTMTFGASGGSWIVGGGIYLNGVNSYITSSTNSEYIYGPYFDDVIRNLINLAQ